MNGDGSEDATKNNGVFRYFDGESHVYGDPFDIDLRFDRAMAMEDMETLKTWMDSVPTVDGKLDADHARIEDIRLFVDAIDRFLPMIRQALQLQPFDRKTGKGLTAVEVIKTFMEYNLWKESLKKSTEPPPTSSSSSDSGTSSSMASTGLSTDPATSAVPESAASG